MIPSVGLFQKELGLSNDDEPTIKPPNHLTNFPIYHIVNIIFRVIKSDSDAEVDSSDFLNDLTKTSLYCESVKLFVSVSKDITFSDQSVIFGSNETLIPVENYYSLPFIDNEAIVQNPLLPPIVRAPCSIQEI
jgi:hypothetical protein